MNATSPVKRIQSHPALWFGALAYALHFLLALALFLYVHRSRGAQGEIAWMSFMIIDMPLAQLLWEHVSTTKPFVALMEWGYTWGSGANLRAFVVHGLLAGFQWFVLTYAAVTANLLAIRTIRHRQSAA